MKRTFTTLTLAVLLVVSMNQLTGNTAHLPLTLEAPTLEAALASPAPFSSLLPNWKNSQLKIIVKKFQEASDAFYKTADFLKKSPRKQEAAGNDIADFYSANRGMIARQPMINKMFIVFLAAEGYISRSPELICESAKEADAYYQEINRKIGDGRRLDEFLKIHFKVDENFMARFYASDYAQNNGLERNPVSCCLDNDKDGDGFCNAVDCCPEDFGVGPCGCPTCQDTDTDGICDDEDECPLIPGTAANNGRPDCPDADLDCICDAQDACPNEAGFLGNQGCPVQDTVDLRNGGMFIIGPQKTYYEKDDHRVESEDAYQMLTDIIMQGGLNDERIELSQAVTSTSLGDQFANSPYLLLRLEFLSQYGKQVIVFEGGKYRIISELHPDRYPSFVASFANFVKCLEILRFDLNFTGDDFLILAQGKADSPLMKRTLIQPDDQWQAFTNSIFYRYDKVSGTMVKSNYQLKGKYYENPDLPYLRAAWLMQQLKAQAILSPYISSMVTLEGIVLDHPDPEERSGTLFIALHKEKAAEKLQAIQKRLQEENDAAKR